MRSVGLVLGAGGVVGGAYHAGAMAALAESTGWDPRGAELIVGTSAGAWTAASLRSGLSAADNLARSTGRPLSAEGMARIGPDRGPLRLDDATPVRAGLLAAYLPQAPWLLGPALLRNGPIRWGVALAGVVPAGRTPTAAMGDRVRATATGRWPTEPTWIVAYRTRDARRVVFGRDDVDVPDLATAIEASSAVPGRFAPVRMASGRYIDGAVYSPTNADLVAGLGFDLVIVSSPMSVAAAAMDDRGSLAGRTRAWFGRLLAREVASVRARGAEVLVLEPGRAEMAAVRADLPEREQAPLVAEAAHASVQAYLAEGQARSVVEQLGSDA